MVKNCVKFILSFCLLSSTLYAQKLIEIDLAQTLVAQEQAIVVNVNERDLPDLRLRLKGVNASDDETKFTFSGGNFTDPSGVIEASKTLNRVANTVSFNLADLKRVTVPVSGFYEYKIAYSGGQSYSAVTGGVIKSTVKILPKRTVTDKTYSDLEIQAAAVEYVKAKHNPEKFYSDKMGIYLEKNTVHIFIDQNGNLIYTGIPTTAKETFLYQVHLLVAKGTTGTVKFKFTSEGKFAPKFNIQKTSEDVTKLNAQEEEEELTPIIEEIEMAKIGPFTDNFTIKLDKIVTGPDGKPVTETLLNNKIDVAKLFHVSISTGLLATTLRNPQSVEKMALPGGTDSTLIADDPNARGVVTIMATFYPKGRSFLFAPSGGVFDPTRFGIQVGAQFNDKLSENFFLGLSHDFARGGCISYGAHFGRRNYVAGRRDFNFGKDVFDLPTLEVKREWALGFYFGVVIDTRVALELFKGLGTSK